MKFGIIREITHLNIISNIFKSTVITGIAIKYYKIFILSLLFRMEEVISLSWLKHFNLLFSPKYHISNMVQIIQKIDLIIWNNENVENIHPYELYILMWFKINGYFRYHDSKHQKIHLYSIYLESIITKFLLPIIKWSMSFFVE